MSRKSMEVLNFSKINCKSESILSKLIKRFNVEIRQKFVKKIIKKTKIITNEKIDKSWLINWG